ncbi:MAG: multicopper oxidase domain-containing protein, partial [Betaproteobacteria bacterium]
MSDVMLDEPARRDFLKLGVAITTGVIVPPILSACGGGDGDSGYKPPTETFFEPLNIQSVNGVLDVTLNIAYVTSTITNIPPGATTPVTTKVKLRNMYGTLPAPTLRMNVGDKLRIRVVNLLPVNPPDPEPTKHLRYHNSTNLHTHGLHVYPDIIRQPTPADPAGLYGDFVVDDPDAGIQPGEIRQYEYMIRSDHPAGTYWYHPHLHGSSAMQVGSGMAGALIIEGPIDEVPEIAAAQERIFVFQAPIYDASGQLENFGQVATSSAGAVGEPGFLINGVLRPRILMKTGEVQNWRFINAAIFNMLNLSLDGHTLYQYSHDGNPRHNLKPVAPLPLPVVGAPPPTAYPEAIVLAAANRTNVLVKAGAPGTYQLRTMPVEIGRNPAGVLPMSIVADIVVTDDPYPMSLPTGPLPVTPFLAPITDEELAAHGGLKRTIVMRVVGSNPPATFPQTDPPTPPILPFTGTAKTPLINPPDGELPDWVFQTAFGQPLKQTPVANKVYALGSAGTVATTSPGMPSEYIPFQSSRALTQTVALNSVEEWTIVNMNNIRHPFHIHVNPMY